LPTGQPETKKGKNAIKEEEKGLDYFPDDLSGDRGRGDEREGGRRRSIPVDASISIVIAVREREKGDEKRGGGISPPFPPATSLFREKRGGLKRKGRIPPQSLPTS